MRGQWNIPQSPDNVNRDPPIGKIRATCALQLRVRRSRDGKTHLAPYPIASAARRFL